MEEEGMEREEDKKMTGEEKEENKEEEVEYLCRKESDRSKANNAGK